MASHLEKGKKGEDLARDFLVGKGYEILHRNWRYLKYEIDLIASRDQKLHFIEVKTRTSKTFGLPEDNVDGKKFSFLQNAAEEFLYQHPGWKRIQFDILSVLLIKNEEPSFLLIEDVYI